MPTINLDIAEDEQILPLALQGLTFWDFSGQQMHIDREFKVTHKTLSFHLNHSKCFSQQAL